MKATRNKFKDQLVKRVIEAHFNVSSVHNYQALICRYTRSVLERRWHMAEPLIKKDDWWWKWYCAYFNLDKE